jgi:hypothetical protein
MRIKNGLAFAVLLAAAVTLAAQQATTTTSTTTSKTTTVSGEVVSYEPGKTIVIRDPNSRTVTYTLDSGLVVPSEVQVGRKVTIYSSPIDGSIRVQKITSYETTNPDGSTSTTTRVKEEPGYTSGAGSTSNPEAAQPAQSEQPAQTTTTTTTKTTRIMGTVSAYEPGQSITIAGPNSKTTTYTITTDSQLPTDVAVGKQVTVETSVVSGKPVARTVTYRTTTKTTKTKSVNPQ